MNIIRQYRKWIQMEFLHEFYKDEISKDFDLVPTSECARTLKNHGFVFRSFLGGAGIYAEWSGADMDNLKMVRPIKKAVKFSFMVVPKHSYLIGITKLFDAPENEKSSRGVFYFTNLKFETGEIDFDMDDSKSLLSKGLYVRDSDKMPVYAKRFSVPFDPDQDDELRINISMPGSGLKNVISIKKEDVKNKRAEIDLSKMENGRYQMEWVGSEPRQNVFYAAEQNIGSKNILGIIEVFKDENADYDNFNTYFLQFQRKEQHWKYVIIDNNNLFDNTQPNLFSYPDAAPTPYPGGVNFNEIDKGDIFNFDEIISFHPGKIYVFESDRKLPAFENGLNIKLNLNNGKTVPLPILSKTALKPEIFINL